MKKILSVVFRILLLAVGIYLIYDGLFGNNGMLKKTQSNTNIGFFAQTELTANDVMAENTYFDVEKIRFVYNGRDLQITNNSTDSYRIGCSVVGVKKDGSYEWLGGPALHWDDQKQYDLDKADNGWAVMKSTSLIRPNETVVAEFKTNVKLLAALNKKDDKTEDMDVDGDGYWDIMFTANKQMNETDTLISIDSPTSEIFKFDIKQ